MARLFGVTGLVLIPALLLLAYVSTFRVDEREQAIVLQLGAPVRVVKEPGLDFLIPFFQNVVFLEDRILELNAERREIIAGDRKRVIVDAFARWRITEPLRFYQSQRDEGNARLTLNTFLAASVRDVINSEPLSVLLSDRRDEMMKRIRDDVNRKVASLGIEIVDVRLRQVELPPENRTAVFGRMQTERQREANAFRGEGRELAATTRSQADRDAVVIRAEAERKAAVLRGEGDAERAKIYADAFNRDPEFYAFYRSMQAYEASLKSDSTTMVITPDSDYFRYFGQPRPSR